jgi:hypothetical protein
MGCRKATVGNLLSNVENVAQFSMGCIEDGDFVLKTLNFSNLPKCQYFVEVSFV